MTTLADPDTTYTVFAGTDDVVESNEKAALINPATEDRIGYTAISGSKEMDIAVEAAAAAQKQWWALPAPERGNVIHRFGQLVAANAEKLGAIDSINMGKPLPEAIMEVRGAVRVTGFWSGVPERLLGEQIPLDNGILSFTKREPVGVVGAILPWNGPSVSCVIRIASATACGNGVLIKPSEWTPMSAVEVAKLSIEAGMPRGLVSVVPGDGTTGQLVSSHPGVGAVRFTGSVPTGRKVAATAGEHLKKVTLELGGKSPNIVFADADLNAAAAGSVWGVFWNAGQACIAPTRLLVQRSVAAEFIDALSALAQKVRVGDPREEGVHIGPVAFKRQYERVLSATESAVSDGAEVRCGGGRPKGVSEKGYYVAPTVLAGVRNDMQVAQSEIFGPVLSVIEFEDEDEALSIANDVTYGLAANLWTNDVSRTLRFGDLLQAGAVACNTARVMDPMLSYEGYKDSGIGNGQADGAIEAFTLTKRISIRYGAEAMFPQWGDL
jgi:acyl-CoA reductase-like NAD-dependent aldehyde dehydrogenase